MVRPHLLGTTPEFQALSDVEANVEGILIRMHTQVLARGSKVFAELFTSIQDDAGMSISSAFYGENYETVVTTLYCMYNLQEVAKLCSLSSPVNFPWIVTDRMMQSVAALAYKLDASILLDEMETYFAKEPSFAVQHDPLSWFIVGRQINAHMISYLSFRELVDICSMEDRAEVLKLLRKSEWRQLDTSDLLMILDATISRRFQEVPCVSEYFEDFRVWSDIGDFTDGKLERQNFSENRDALGDVDEVWNQAYADYEEEWNDAENIVENDD